MTTTQIADTKMTARQEALATRLGFDSFAELADEISNHDPRHGVDYFEAMTEDELEAYSWEG